MSNQPAAGKRKRTLMLTESHWEGAKETLAAQGISHTRAIDTFLAYLAGEDVELPRRAFDPTAGSEPSHPADRPAPKLPQSVITQATRAVVRRLCKPVDVWDTEGDILARDTSDVDSFTVEATRWLGDKSNLASTTVANADWLAVYESFLIRQGDFSQSD